MGCNDYVPLTNDQRNKIAERERELKAEFEAEVQMYTETAETILEGGAQVWGIQLKELVRAKHMPNEAAIREAVRRLMLSGKYGHSIGEPLRAQTRDD